MLTMTEGGKKFTTNRTGVRYNQPGWRGCYNLIKLKNVSVCEKIMKKLVGERQKSDETLSRKWRPQFRPKQLVQDLMELTAL